LNQTDLTAKLITGDPSVFSDIVEQCQAMVYNTILNIVQNEEDAEDLTQDVFIEVYETIRNFRQEAKLSTWMYRIAVNKALDFEKGKKRQKHGGLLKRIFSVGEGEEPASFHHPGAQLDNKEKAAILFKAIKKLPRNQQVAFTLHKIEGLPYKEVADVMEISLQAVESLTGRAKSGLKKILEQYYQSSK
jgi:RNA polymerase sigma factor (sigma-70 family)